VGGGLTEGRGVLETALKEAGEEAGLPQQLAAGSVISHYSVNIHPVLRIRGLFGPLIRYPGWVKFFLNADPGIFLTLDPGWKKFGSGINIPDPQHCIHHTPLMMKTSRGS
jgi:hypothetical protein